MSASLHGTNGLTLPDGSIMARIPRSWLAGLTLSTAGSSATFSVAAGQAADSTNAQLMDLTSALSKTTSAWAVGTGNGALDTGAIANSTWYHVYLIKRVDTGVVDVLISTSASAPTMPTNYTLKRRIGSMKTNGSAQWTLFIQVGDLFTWDVAVVDYSATTPANTNQATLTLTVPTGVKVEAWFTFRQDYVSGGNAASLISSFDITDSSAGTTSTTVTGVAATVADATLWIITNTSANVRCRSNATTITYDIYTRGWLDRRGKDD